MRNGQSAHIHNTAQTHSEGATAHTVVIEAVLGVELEPEGQSGLWPVVEPEVEPEVGQEVEQRVEVAVEAATEAEVVDTRQWRLKRWQRSWSMRHLVQQLAKAHLLELHSKAPESWTVVADYTAWSRPPDLWASLQDEQAVLHNHREQTQRETASTLHVVGTEGIHSALAVDTDGALRRDAAEEDTVRVEGGPLRERSHA